jgi:hypothetical protein
MVIVSGCQHLKHPSRLLTSAEQDRDSHTGSRQRPSPTTTTGAALVWFSCSPFFKPRIECGTGFPIGMSTYSLRSRMLIEFVSDSGLLIFSSRGSIFFRIFLSFCWDLLSRRMVPHPIPRRHALRQLTGAPTPPSVSGLTNAAITQTSVAADTTSLSFDSASHLVPSFSTAPQLATTTPIITTSQPSTTQIPVASTPSAVSSASGQIPISTVVGSCVGALIGTVALVLLGVWFYRRYSKSLKKRASPRGPIAHTRNAYAEEARTRSRSELWKKLEDGDDKWEGMYQTKEVDNTDVVAPMEKLTMFKKSPSVRTAYTHKSEEPVAFDPQTFAQYHPSLAEELASDKITGMTVPRPFLGRMDPENPISWDGETLGNGSLNSVFSLRSNRMEGGAMSPTLNMAIPTPAATSSQPHRWQSAEVVDLDGHSAEVVDPLEEDNRRKSPHNPFFNAQDISIMSTSRAFSDSMAYTSSKPSMEEEHFNNSNPFSDDNGLSFPRPFIQHGAKDSLASVSSADRALQNLIAALEIPEEEVQERLRVASMQPSFISNTSVYTSGGEEEDVTQAFPLPPSTDGKHIYRQ